MWDAADKMRGNLEAAEYKHVALGLVFLKYVSDAFEQRRRYLVAATAGPVSTRPTLGAAAPAGPTMVTGTTGRRTSRSRHGCRSAAYE